MFVIHAVQSHFGDCLLLEYGTAAAPRFLLVDGGPEQTFEPHLRRVLQDRVMPNGGRLDRIIVSHVDRDHIVGILDLLSDLRARIGNGEPDLLQVDGLWHNSFARTVDPDNLVRPRLAGLLANTRVATLDHAGASINGIEEGNRLRQVAGLLGIALNGDLDDPVTVDSAPDPVTFGNLQLTVVGPTQANLDALREAWLAWLDEHEDALADDDPQVRANADRSVPNLSSLCVVAEADGKRALLTGDARSDHLLQGLEARGLLDAQGQAHFDLLKLPHHGSDRNITKTFFKRVTADRYLACADGTHGNPDLATLIWLVEAAQAQGRAPEIIVTNRTDSTDKLLAEYPPADFGYTLRSRAAANSSVTMALG